MRDFQNGMVPTTTGPLALAKGARAFRNLKPAQLVEHSLQNGEGVLADTGALACDTGRFTGRDPQNRFIVKDSVTENRVWWGDVNMPVTQEVASHLLQKIKSFMSTGTIYVTDAFAGADPNHRLRVRVLTTKAFHAMFVNNMFVRPTAEELENFDPQFTVFCAPEFEADPEVDGVPHKNFAILDIERGFSLVGGTGYTGEIKKGIFSVLNFTLPTFENVLPMHCSANVGEAGDVALFFGLSGTGKTTLSADPNRYLVGDDEHGWHSKGIFNFEGGCYAKVINLKQETEPDIYHAIKFGAILENVRFFPNTRTVDYFNKSVTENTRVSYPIDHIAKVAEGLVAGIPKNIFFLTCDAHGVLPPISKLTTEQAMFHFVSGYTAKVAGTEVGITEPKTVFSTCFGAPFMPLHPAAYAKLLAEKLAAHGTTVWLVNTGWTGGGYGIGHRMSLPHTRALLTAAMEGKLDNVDFLTDPIFGLQYPANCAGVPAEILNPKNTWADPVAYDKAAEKLAAAFLKNFQKFADQATEAMWAGAPKLTEHA